MDYRDFEHIGKEIGDLVQSAVDSRNFTQLNATINQALDSARQGIHNATRPKTGQPDNYQTIHAERRVYHSQVRGSSFTNYGQSPAARAVTDPRFARNPKGRISGPLLTSLGFSLAGIFGLSTLILWILLLYSPPVGIKIAANILFCFSGISLGVGFIGNKKWKLFKRFRNYVRALGDRTYCSIEELSQMTNRKKNALLSDLRTMIEKGMFPQGHLDRQNTCLILTNEVYQQYCITEKEMERKKREQSIIDMQPKQAQLPAECQRILDEGNEYITHIHHCNDLLPGVEISEKLSRLETIMTKIFGQIKKNPDLAPELHKFMNYYLPTTRKLLDAYCELDAQPVTGENISSTKLEIERTLDTINEAFENLLDRFFEDTAWDISSDISVMKTMLAQEGLTQDALTKAGKERSNYGK